MCFFKEERNEVGDRDDAEDETLCECEERSEIICDRIEVNDEADDEEDVHVNRNEHKIEDECPQPIREASAPHDI